MSFRLREKGKLLGIIVMAAGTLCSGCMQNGEAAKAAYKEQEPAASVQQSQEAQADVGSQEDEADGSKTADKMPDFVLKLRNKQGMADKEGIYYEIFVRAFADSNGDGIGDLKGVTDQLDYLKDLGVDGLWLMPIYKSSSYHGYDVTDYLSVNPEYGTEEDLKQLLEEAHKRDIKVILDFVANHTSSQHPWFQSACQSEDSPYRAYYRFVEKENTEECQPNAVSAWSSLLWHPVGDAYYYGIFSDTMPDLNYNNPEVRQKMKSAAKKWLSLGVDGFRLDGAVHIYGVHEFEKLEGRVEHNVQWWNEFACACEEVNPEVYLVGETWQNQDILPEYAQPFDSKFDFPMADSITSAVSSGMAFSVDKKPLSEKMEEIIEANKASDTNYIDGIFAGNHDKTRIMTAVRTEEKAKLVSAIVMTLPGNPFIYYGDELGLKGNVSDGDDHVREPFKWNEEGSAPYANWMQPAFGKSWSTSEDVPSLEEQKKDEHSIYQYYKQMIQLRKEHPALSKGDFKGADIKGISLFAYTRSCEDETLLVLHNLGDKEAAASSELIKGGEVIFDSSSQAVCENDKITLAPCSTVVVKVKA